MLERAGFRIVHVDVVVALERPRLLPYRAAMRANLAKAMGVAETAVSLKAKTAEGIGPVGLGEAAEAWAVATVSIVGSSA